MTKRALVAGGAGFIGSHLVDRLLAEDFLITVVDNLITGRQKNLAHLAGNKNLTFIKADVSQALPANLRNQKFDFVFHLASPASPRQYAEHPLETIAANTGGTQNLLELAGSRGTRFLFASTSEVYGEPQVHPQTEDYRGNVNPVGPRAPYDEAKRLGETLVSVYQTKFAVDSRIVRIFNTYGPRMQNEDGRAIPNFITQALAGEPITIYGDGSQTRSFCYVSDMVEGILKAMFGQNTSGQVFNLGNPQEISIQKLAELVKKLIGAKTSFNYQGLPEEDPTRRRPDIGRAKKILGWEPKVPLAAGLVKTIDYFKTIHESRHPNSHL